MQIGIIGPSNINGFCRTAGINKTEYLIEVAKISKIVASSKNEIVIVPEKKSVSEKFAREFRKAGGKKIIGIIPMDDTEFGIKNLDENLVDEIINCVTWRNQPAKLAESSDLLLCLGLGAGTLTEVFVTKYFKAKVIVIEEFITRRLPKETLRDIDLKYVKIKEVKSQL